MGAPSPVQSIAEIDALLRAAITKRRPVSAVYEGRSRLLCPQMIGRSRSGQVRVLCLQFGGDSISGLQHPDTQGDWRCLAVEKFSSAEFVEAWRTPVGSLRQPKCIDQIELQVADQPDRPCLAPQ